MAGPGQALDLAGSLAELQAILDVVCGVPGSIAADERAPFYFPNVGASGEILPDGSTNANTLAKCEYTILSVVSLGTDEQRSVLDPNAVIAGDTYTPPQGGLVVSVHGPRQVNVQIKAESFAPTGGGAFAYAERSRTRLRLPTVTARLESVGLAVSHITDTRPADYTDPNGRIVSVAWFEVVFNAADSASDDPVTTIENVETDDPEIT